MNINTVTVIGANGAMGSTVGAIFASFGNAKVYMVARDIDKAREGVKKAIHSVKADGIAGNLIPVDYSSLAECVSQSDLIFESTVEDLSIKMDVMKLIVDHLHANTLVCTGSSGLSITKLAELLPEHLRSNCFGAHMFNPPYSMPLCELILTKYSTRALVSDFKSYLTEKLLRMVVEVADSPAFLANRIGFWLINEAMRRAEENKDRGGIDYIDAILGGYTGRSMAPLVTADFVGLDIHKAIVDNLYFNTQDYAHAAFALPAFAQDLIEKGLLGRKSKAGLYKMVTTDEGLKKLAVYDVATGTYREARKYTFPFTEKMVAAFHSGDYLTGFSALVTDRSFEAELCLEFLLHYIIYSFVTAKAVGDSIHSADDVMATGFNWCPPLALANALTAVCDVKELVKERIPAVYSAVDIGMLWDTSAKSTYDYRQYFRAVR